MNMAKKIEIRLLKAENANSIYKQLQEATNEENRLMGLLTDEDSGSTPELRAVQNLRDVLGQQVNEAINNAKEIAKITDPGYSFVDRYFNAQHVYDVKYSIAREEVANFIANCNLALETPEVAESILPIIKPFETPVYAEDDEYHEEPIYYTEQYINNVRNVRNVFNDILNNTNWDNDDILILLTKIID